MNTEIMFWEGGAKSDARKKRFGAREEPGHLFLLPHQRALKPIRPMLYFEP
jgi:hypothetical protein